MSLLAVTAQDRVQNIVRKSVSTNVKLGGCEPEVWREEVCGGERAGSRAGTHALRQGEIHSADRGLVVKLELKVGRGVKLRKGAESESKKGQEPKLETGRELETSVGAGSESKL
ncbi:hypothetical protein EVAR_77217_1 [Eumeta japonica]|uniref:Uncharacterized protein n=1 Tax=Eumeta variegata TaxID=151549 RepID=A0A4C1T519_EUMVA|nr:hypothetical protein EVAR_77217_1 [Eumeta japonica]